MYPVGTDYNGGFHEYTYKNGKTTFWRVPNKEPIKAVFYKGFRLKVSPKIPAGYKLTSIYCGLQLNAMPPLASSYLEPLDGKKKTRKEVKAAIEAANNNSK